MWASLQARSRCARYGAAAREAAVLARRRDATVCWRPAAHVRARAIRRPQPTTGSAADAENARMGGKAVATLTTTAAAATGDAGILTRRRALGEIGTNAGSTGLAGAGVRPPVVAGGGAGATARLVSGAR